MALENIEDIYRLSPVQQGMLFHTLAAPASGVYFEQFSLAYGEAFDPEAFARAWQRAVDRHPVLRTSFLWEDLEQPVQVVHRRVELAVDRQDWRRLSPAERDERLRAYAAADRRAGFDLARPPLLRLGFIRTGEEEHRVVWGYHHLLLDGWSAGLVMREVFALYREESGGEPAQLEPRRPYKDYVDWLLAQDLSAAEAYWRRTLAGFAAPTALGVDATAPATQEADPGYELRLLRVPAPATAALKAFAQGHRLTLNTLLQGAWALLLARTSGEEDVVFGTTVSGRPPSLPGVESMIGCFINTLPVRVRVAPGQELAPWLRELQGALAEMRRYEHSPLAQVLGWSEVPRSLPLFESIVVFESFTPESAFEMSHSGVFQRTNYPLTLVVSPGEELTLRLGYEMGCFSADAIERLLCHLEVLLAGMAGGGSQRLEELPLLSAPERQQVLVEWNDTRVEEFLAPGLTLHGLVAAQAARTPEAVAVVFEGKRLTYRELDARANRLARHLRRLRVGPEAPVGVCLERSVELVVALLGILKAGGAYLPLDPSYPSERLGWMLADARRSGAPVLLVQERLLTAVPEAARVGVRVVLLETGWGAAMDGGEPDPKGGAGPDHAAYVIYTSGSTGKPKGAVNTHRAIVNRLLWMQETYRLAADDRVLQKTPFSFDVSVWEFFWPLLTGARLVVARPGGHQDPPYLARLIVEHGITTVHFVPAMLHAFLDEPEAERCRSLRRVIASGEALPADLVRRFRSRFAPAGGVGLHNLYGPTEAAVDVTFWPCDRPAPGPTAPIGRPVANTEIRLLDAGLQPVPIGVPGELHIGGVQLARGYLGRPDLTAEKFIPDPFRAEPGARLYKTGDLARYGTDGTIEFLGRIDHQVKIRGVRIELGEIETVLSTHPAVRAAVVLVREDRPGDRRLVAYVIPRDGREPHSSDLRKHLRTRLPDYMVPNAFVGMVSWPLTPNGKVDRRALPAPERVERGQAKLALGPRTENEQAIAAIWQQMLAVEEVGVEDDFYEIGGHSLLLVQMASRVRERLGKELPLARLLAYRTVASLAAAVEEAQNNASGDSPATLEAELRANAVLPRELAPAAPPPARALDPRAVFLTGGTGFLGAYLLAELLRQSRATVFCLVRADNAQAGLEKLRRELASLGLWDPAFAFRITAVPGDLSRPLLGLSKEGFEQLCGSVEAIYHNGAVVDFLAPYAALKAVNVLGTLEVLRLACTGAAKPLHHVSTLGVLDSAAHAAAGEAWEDDPLGDCAGLAGGYAQSKWVAETLVRAAGERGLPVAIYRPGTIAGDSRTGQGNPKDFATSLIKGSIQLGAAPRTEAAVNLAPVDFVGRAIVWLSRQPEPWGRTFHLINPQPLVAPVLVEWIRAAGYPLDELPPEVWRETLIRRVRGGEENALAPFLPLYEEAAARASLAGGDAAPAATVRYDAEQTFHALAGGPVTCPPVADLLATYFAYFIRSGFLPEPGGGPGAAGAAAAGATSHLTTMAP